MNHCCLVLLALVAPALNACCYSSKMVAQEVKLESLDQSERAYALESAQKLLAEKVRVVPFKYMVRMSDREFNDEYGNRHDSARRHYKNYQASGALRDRCYVYVFGVKKESITLLELLQTVRKPESVAQQVVDYQDLKLWSQENVPAPDGFASCAAIVDHRENNLAAILYLLKNR